MLGYAGIEHRNNSTQIGNNAAGQLGWGILNNASLNVIGDEAGEMPPPPVQLRKLVLSADLKLFERPRSAPSFKSPVEVPLIVSWRILRLLA